jgi:hypothetical protein
VITKRVKHKIPVSNSKNLQGESLVMGRGRSKAKQTKVARDLKYGNQETDLEALAKELRSTKSKEDEIEQAWQELEKDK